MIIYIDDEHKCHVENDGTMREFEVLAMFDGKCKDFIEGFCYYPPEEEYVRPIDGERFPGGLIFAWKDYSELEKIQLAYEKEYIEQALRILISGKEGVEP